jgi:citrate synthase
MLIHKSIYCPAQEAAAALGITKATLYAYASRGQVHSEPMPGNPRERRYRRDEIERWRERQAARRDPVKAAAQGLHWGSPVLDSAITLIHDGRLYYRGEDAIKLAARASLEQVAALLWEAQGPQSFDQPCTFPLRRMEPLRRFGVDRFTLLQAVLPLAAATDASAYDLRPHAVRQTGARVLRLATAALTGDSAKVPIHLVLAAAWAARSKTAAELIRTALVLCADHELNVSAFAARCAASAAASPYDAISAALATLKGHKHGGASERVAALFRETKDPQRALAVMRAWLQRGEHIPGFGHPLYPNGDPRALPLLEYAYTGHDTSECRLVRALVKAGGRLLQEAPNVDFALTAACRAHRLPADGPLLLFALGRTTGWIAHIMEQYTVDKLIRPRASYTGPAPS